MTTVYCVHRRIEQIGDIVTRLTNIFGEGQPVDTFSESLCFVPQNQVGNLNYINRDVLVDIEYSAGTDTCLVHHVGANTRRTEKAGVNIRRLFVKTGFSVKSDYAKKGLIYKTRMDQTISLTRPYNASLVESALYENNVAAWTPIPGPFPFGTDYLFEISQNISSETLADATILNLKSILDKIVTI